MTQFNFLQLNFSEGPGKRNDDADSPLLNERL